MSEEFQELPGDIDSELAESMQEVVAPLHINMPDFGKLFGPEVQKLSDAVSGYQAIRSPSLGTDYLHALNALKPAVDFQPLITETMKTLIPQRDLQAVVSSIAELFGWSNSISLSFDSIFEIKWFDAHRAILNLTSLGQLNPELLQSVLGLTKDLASIAERYEAVKYEGLPLNLREALKEISMGELHRFVLVEPMAVYGVPRASTLVRFVRAETSEKRRKLLNSKYSPIVDDCEIVLGSLSPTLTRNAVGNAKEAIKAIRANCNRAAQALLTVTIDSLISKLIPDHKIRGKITKRPKDADPPLKLDENYLPQVWAWLPIWNAHGEFRRGKGDQIPYKYNRHATVHAAEPRQFSKRNTAQALALLTSLILYAEEHPKEFWGAL
ncbi:MAG: hypothetical protein Q4D87_05895 [Actinomycetaceae bacterium]|nr:hypothetical protein [Actinomycetaceae bacterium]